MSRWLPAAVATLVAIIAYFGDTAAHPVRLALGQVTSEAPGHLWSLWSAARGVLEHGPFVRVAAINYPDGFRAHLADPIDLLPFLLGYWALGGGVSGATLGWFLVHLSMLLAGAAGTWLLVRRLFGAQPAWPWAAGLAVLGVCANSFLLNWPFMGRTEDLPALLLPLHLALLHRALSPDGRRRDALTAGLALGATALGGWYVALFSVLVVVPVSLVWAARLPSRREAALRLALAAGVSFACILPALHALLTWPPPELDPMGTVVRRASTQLGVPIPSALRLPRAVLTYSLLQSYPYPGWVFLGLGLLGAVFRPRRALGWLLLGCWLLVTACGPVTNFGFVGHHAARPWATPAWFIAWLVPPARNVSGWFRLGIVVTIPFAIAAIHGFLALFGRRPCLAAVATALLAAVHLVDAGTWPRTWTFHRPAFLADMPADYADAVAVLPPGALVEYPLDVQLERGVAAPHAIYPLWQLQHGRPLSTRRGLSPDGTLPRHYLSRLVVSWQDRIPFTVVGLVKGGATLPPPTPGDVACVRADAAALVEEGYAGAVLHLSIPGGPLLRDNLEAVLGPPAFAGTSVVAWDLRRVPPARPAGDCEPPALPSALRRLEGEPQGGPPPAWTPAGGSEAVAP